MHEEHDGQVGKIRWQNSGGPCMKQCPVSRQSKNGHLIDLLSVRVVWPLDLFNWVVNFVLRVNLLANVGKLRLRKASWCEASNQPTFSSDSNN